MVVVVVLALVAAMVAVEALMGFRSAAVGCSNSSASLLLLLLLFLILLDSNASLVCVVEAIHFSHHVPFAEDGI